jgi:hypothetical protein
LAALLVVAALCSRRRSMHTLDEYSIGQLEIGQGW